MVISAGLPVAMWIAPPTVAELDEVIAALARWRPVLKAYEHEQIALAPEVFAATRRLLMVRMAQRAARPGDDDLRYVEAALAGLLTRIEIAAAGGMPPASIRR